jgi:hypothetical protein
MRFNTCCPTSQLNRIENAEMDVPIGTLIRIARFLHIGIDNLIAPPPWQYSVTALVTGSGRSGEPENVFLSKPHGSDHFLHPSWWSIPAGATVNMEDLGAQEPGTVASWIVMGGRMIVGIRAGLESSLELLENGSVIHFRRAIPTHVQALEPSRLLQVIYSGNCTCSKRIP